MVKTSMYNSIMPLLRHLLPRGGYKWRGRNVPTGLSKKKNWVEEESALPFEEQNDIEYGLFVTYQQAYVA